MSINDPTATTLTRQPLCRVLTGGTEIPGVMSFSVQNNSYHQADSFSATFALSAGGTTYSADFWSSQSTDILLDISASLDNGTSWRSLILGAVDKITFNPIHRTVTVSGRDLSSRFIDAKTRQTFQNQTSSQVVQQLAGKRGMTADVTSTGTPVGRYYDADHTRMTLNSMTETTTEWDLLTFLAEQEGYDVWVSGTTIHFHPTTPPNADPYDVIISDDGQCNAVSITLERSQALAKDIVVAVRSWNSKQRKGFTVYNPGPPSANSTAQEFSIVRPNLTGDQAQDLANRIRTDLSQQERLGTFELIPDLTLDPRGLLRLRGTNSSWDQTYFIDSVTRSMSFNSFAMQVHVKNHSLVSEPATP
jgi:phage protein D